MTGQLTVTNPAGQNATIHFDGDDRVDWIQDSAGGQFDLTYNANGQLATITYPAPQTGATSPHWSYNYTDDGLLEYITDPNLKIHKIAYTDGKVSKLVAPEGVVNTSGTETDDAADYTKTYTYATSSALSRFSGTILVTTPQTTVTENDGGQWLYFYNSGEGVLIGKQDPLGNLTEYGWYDSSSPYNGQREYTLTPIEENGNDVHYRMTRYTSYDSHGNPLDITSHIHTITYDTAGNPVNSVDAPVHRHLTYNYGSYNRPTSITDVITATTTTIDYVEPGDGTEVVTITAPKINASDAEAPQTVIVYRADGQIDSITDPLNRTVDYTYDGRGILTHITDPNNIISSFSNFDDLGLAETLTLTANDGSTTRTTSLDYDASHVLCK